MQTVMTEDMGLTHRSLDPDLSFIASQAAIELDNLLLRTGGGLDAVARLAGCLQRSTGITGGGTETKHLMAPQTIDILSRAIDASGDQRITTIDELARRASQIAADLGASKSGGGDDQIKRLRDFCVALSRVAAADRRAMLDMRPSRPLRS